MIIGFFYVLNTSVLLEHFEVLVLFVTFSTLEL